jgi:EAL domain-containing protein (putative c-di-GMP-specific phosphodiesterase class I)
MDITALRFLVVEDQGFQRWMLQRMLQDLGAEHVYGAEDGKAALDIMATLDQAVDVVVSDLDMPGMDGMEFIRRVAEDRRDVAFMVLSAQEAGVLAAVESMASAYGVRFLGAIAKPATPHKLRAALEAHEAEVSRPHPEPPLPYFSDDELRKSLAFRQIAAHFQPKVDLLTGKVVGAEALARWMHPVRGILAPKLFIESMESHGLITALTESMLRDACTACATWHAQGLPMSVSINVSIGSLAEIGIAERFLTIVEGCGLSPREVTLEVTESAATTELGRVLENLSRLRMRGFGLSIDDYGTGYSSMQQLSRIPFTELKIDQSFVTRAHNHPASRAMVESSLELATKLHIIAVAEGVETDRERRVVREAGCHMAQGYHFGRPMPLPEFIAHVGRPR